MSKIHRNSLKPGHKILWYEVKEILGQGGFGITYLAYDPNLEKFVAIKEYLPIELSVREGDFSVHPVSDDHEKPFKWGLNSFIKEARTLSKFNHPNIVRVLSVTEENNTAYMVMEYEDGQSLQEKLKGRKTLEEAELLKILIPILGGLEIVHKAGFIHRDIKPDNIFIRKDGSPVLLDFGSARQALGEETKTLTSLVSPGYAPFEQYFNKGDKQGAYTDIYGLGATLYRAIAGIAPQDAADRSHAIINSGKDISVTALEVGRGRYSERFLKAIDHAIQFKTKDRPQSIHEWRQEFEVRKEAPEVVESKPITDQKNIPTRVATEHVNRTDKKNKEEIRSEQKSITQKKKGLSFSKLLIISMIIVSVMFLVRMSYLDYEERARDRQKTEEEVVEVVPEQKQDNAINEGKLIKKQIEEHQLSDVKKRVVGIISYLPIFGDENQSKNPWAIISTLREHFEIKNLGKNPDKIEEDIDVLMVIHPKDVKDKTLFAIEQFLLGGGKAMLFVDPLAEADRSKPVQSGDIPNLNSDLKFLFDSWGIEIAEGKIVADINVAMHVQTRSSSGTKEVIYPPWLKLEKTNLNKDDLSTNKVKLLHMGTVGSIKQSEQSTLKSIPLIQTSTKSMKLERDILMSRGPNAILENFKSEGKRQVLAARLSGHVKTAFPQGIDGKDNSALLQEGEINVILVADTDILNDTFWIGSQNGDFVVNSLESLSVQ